MIYLLYDRFLSFGFHYFINIILIKYSNLRVMCMLKNLNNVFYCEWKEGNNPTQNKLFYAVSEYFEETY